MVIHNAAITGSLTLNGIDISDITGSEAGVNALNDFSSSILNYTSSTDARINALNVQTSSLLSYTASNDAKITALNAQTASILSYTSSNDAKIAAIYTATSSLNESVSALNAQTASILSYTSSTDAKISSVYNATSSLQSATSSLQAFSSSILSYTSSNDARIAGLNSFSSSILSYTSSTDAKIASIYSTTASLNAAVSSLNAATASLYTATSSLNARVGSLEAQSASLLSYTSSNSMNVVTLFAASASLNASVAGLNAQSASLLSYTASNSANVSSLFASVSSLSAGSASSAASINALNAQTASLLSYTSSNSANVVTLFATSASLNANVAGLNNYTSSANTRFSSIEASTASLNTFTSSINGRVTTIESKYATTGSNTFTGQQYISNASQANSFTQTASLYTDGGMRVTKDMYVSGTAYFNNITVFGTQSISYISSSQLNIATNIITVNTDTPSIRFGGLAVYDSGSTGLTGSILWDSQNNHWIYTNPSGSSYSGGMLISGPRASSLGNEQGTTNNALMKGQGGDHITSSGVFEISGSVGIGTTNPSTLLHLYGGGGVRAIRVEATTADQFAEMQMSASAREYRLGVGGATSISPSKFYIFDNNVGAFRFTINTDGNVGIGSSSPDYKLDVAGNGRYTGNLSINTGVQTQVIGNDGTYGSTYPMHSFTGTTNGSHRIFAGTADDMYFAAATSRGFEFRANGGTAATLKILSNGNVGVGTASPAADGLTIRREGSDKRTLLQLDRPNNAGLQTNIRFTVADIMVGQIQHEYAASNYNHMSFTLRSPGGSDVIPLWLENSGNVGIGSTSPSYKLDVVGSVKAGSGNTSALLVAATAGGQSMSASIAIQQLTSEGDTIIFADYEPYAEYGIMAKNSVDSIDFIGGPSTGGLTSYSVVNRSGSTRTAYVKTRISLGDGNMYVGGSVGIGTTSPNQQLVVSGSGSDTRIEIGSTTTQGFYFTKNGANNGTFRVDTNGNYEFYTKNVSQAVVITVGGNVGIGTTSPAGLLDISGGSYNTGLIVRSSNTGGTGINLKNTDTGGHDWYIISTASGNGGGAGNLGFYDNTNGNYLMYIKGSDGNVGIGTTNPSFLLNLYGSNAATVYQTSGTGTGAGNGFYVGHTGNVSYVWNYNNFPLVLATNNTERMRIIGDGNVGIGTTSPTSKLYVNGDLTVSAGSIAAFAFGVNSASTFAFGSTNGRRGAIIAHESANDSGLQFGWDTTDKTGIIAGSANVTGAGIDFYTYNGSAWGNRARINKDGNVGIGTTSPGSLLQVGGSGASSTSTPTAIQLDNSYRNAVGGNTALKFYLYKNSNETYGIGLNNAGGIEYHSGTVGDAGSYQAFYFGNSEKIRFKGDGNVGIGTTNPTEALQVAGNIRLGGTSAYNSVAIYNSGSSGGGGMLAYQNGTVQAFFGALGWYEGNTAVGAVIGTDSASRPIVFYTSTERMRIAGGGNVGIGTTSPTLGKLQITGDNNQLAIHTAGSYSSIYFYNAGNDRAGIYVSDTETHFEGRGTSGLFFGGAVSQNHMIITSGGNVGINTTSPATKLQISGVNNDSYGQLRLLATGTGADAQISFETPLNGRGIYVDDSDTNKMKFYTGAGKGVGDMVTFDNSGYVGIGTTSPNGKLSVDGGNIVLNYGNAAANYYLILNKKQGQDGGILFTRDNANDWQFVNTSTGNLLFYSYGTSTEAITFQRSSGNVGIGTTSPAAKLHVAGNGYFSSILEAAGNIYAYNGIQMYRQGTTVTGISWYNSSYYNWQEYMASAGATSCGPNGNLTAPSGLSAVTSWALRSRMEGVSTYGWIWETSSGGGGDANASPKMELGATNGTLQVSGDMVAYASDGRLKTNVKEITNALDKVKQIRGVEYDWVDDIEEKYGFYPTSKHEVGVIAQEMQKVLPEAVLTAPFNGAYKQKYNEDPNFLTVKYDRIVPLLIEAIKELNAKIDRLENNK